MAVVGGIGSVTCSSILGFKFTVKRIAADGQAGVGLGVFGVKNRIRYSERCTSRHGVMGQSPLVMTEQKTYLSILELFRTSSTTEDVKSTEPPSTLSIKAIKPILLDLRHNPGSNFLLTNEFTELLAVDQINGWSCGD